MTPLLSSLGNLFTCEALDKLIIGWVAGGSNDSVPCRLPLAPRRILTTEIRVRDAHTTPLQTSKLNNVFNSHSKPMPTPGEAAAIAAAAKGRGVAQQNLTKVWPLSILFVMGRVKRAKTLTAKFGVLIEAVGTSVIYLTLLRFVWMTVARLIKHRYSGAAKHRYKKEKRLGWKQAASRAGALKRMKEAGFEPGTFVNLSRGRCHYILTGPADGELVVLFHGFGVYSFVWKVSVELSLPYLPSPAQNSLVKRQTVPERVPRLQGIPRPHLRLLRPRLL